MSIYFLLKQLPKISSNTNTNTINSAYEGVMVESKNESVMTIETSRLVHPGDCVVCINDICLLRGVYTYAQQLDMIKSGDRPIVLGFAATLI
jgi:hypothetical protein